MVIPTNNAISTNTASVQSSILPFATLRAHPAPVTSIHFLPYPLSSNNDESDTPIYFLVSSDESGYIYLWSLATRRPFSIFKPHSKSIISVQFISIPSSSPSFESNSTSESNANTGCESQKQQQQQISRILLLSHSRDNSIKIFDLTQLILSQLSLTTSSTNLSSDAIVLPSFTSNSQSSNITINPPPLIYQLPVNALNFCAAATFLIPGSTKSTSTNEHVDHLIIAVPSTLASENIDVYMLSIPPPSSSSKTSSSSFKLVRLCDSIPGPPVTLPSMFNDNNLADDNENINRQNGTGIIMSLIFSESNKTNKDKDENENEKFLILTAGYESGNIANFLIPIKISSPSSSKTSSSSSWSLISHNHVHKQPVLSLSYFSIPNSSSSLNHSSSFSFSSFIYSSGADTRLVCNPISSSINHNHNHNHSQEQQFLPSSFIYKLPSPGTPYISIRDDFKLIATAGWDGLVRIFSINQNRILSILDDDNNNNNKNNNNNNNKNQQQNNTIIINKPIIKPLASFKAGRQKNEITSVAFGPIWKNKIFPSICEKSSSSLSSSLSSSSSSPSSSISSNNNKNHDSTIVMKLKNIKPNNLISSSTNNNTNTTNNHYLAVAGKDGRIGLYQLY